MNIPELLGIQHLIVDEYQDLNMVDLQFVDQVARRGHPRGQRTTSDR